MYTNGGSRPGKSQRNALRAGLYQPQSAKERAYVQHMSGPQTDSYVPDDRLQSRPRSRSPSPVSRFEPRSRNQERERSRRDTSDYYSRRHSRSPLRRQRSRSPMRHDVRRPEPRSRNQERERNRRDTSDYYSRRRSRSPLRRQRSRSPGREPRSPYRSGRQPYTRYEIHVYRSNSPHPLRGVPRYMPTDERDERRLRLDPKRRSQSPPPSIPHRGEADRVSERGRQPMCEADRASRHSHPSRVSPINVQAPPPQQDGRSANQTSKLESMHTTPVAQQKPKSASHFPTPLSQPLEQNSADVMSSYVQHCGTSTNGFAPSQTWDQEPDPNSMDDSANNQLGDDSFDLEPKANAKGDAFETPIDVENYITASNSSMYGKGGYLNIRTSIQHVVKQAFHGCEVGRLLMICLMYIDIHESGTNEINLSFRQDMRHYTPMAWGLITMAMATQLQYTMVDTLITFSIDDGANVDHVLWIPSSTLIGITHNIPGSMQWLKDHLTSKISCIATVVSVGGDHFVAFQLDVGGTCRVYDSLDRYHANSAKMVLQTLVAALRQLDSNTQWGEAKPLKLRYEEWYRQSLGSNDCGIFSAWAVRQILEGRPMQISNPPAIQLTRKFLVQDIICRIERVYKLSKISRPNWTTAYKHVCSQLDRESGDDSDDVLDQPNDSYGGDDALAKLVQIEDDTNDTYDKSDGDDKLRDLPLPEQAHDGLPTLFTESAASLAMIPGVDGENPGELLGPIDRSSYFRNRTWSQGARSIADILRAVLLKNHKFMSMTTLIKESIEEPDAIYRDASYPRALVQNRRYFNPISTPLGTFYELLLSESMTISPRPIALFKYDRSQITDPELLYNEAVSELKLYDLPAKRCQEVFWLVTRSSAYECKILPHTTLWTCYKAAFPTPPLEQIARVELPLKVDRRSDTKEYAQLLAHDYIFLAEHITQQSSQNWPDDRPTGSGVIVSVLASHGPVKIYIISQNLENLTIELNELFELRKVRAATFVFRLAFSQDFVELIGFENVTSFPYWLEFTLEEGRTAWNKFNPDKGLYPTSAVEKHFYALTQLAHNKTKVAVRWHSKPGGDPRSTKMTAEMLNEMRELRPGFPDSRRSKTSGRNTLLLANGSDEKKDDNDLDINSGSGRLVLADAPLEPAPMIGRGDSKSKCLPCRKSKRTTCDGSHRGCANNPTSSRKKDARKVACASCGKTRKKCDGRAPKCLHNPKNVTVV
ncbi:hypothetical protein P153DRAFT_406952 [Dothidotthia symphoricarpi CBS 119687]|uniref:Ubiquitin-like protease family profile domain-containing protein n=1 Tax=Dothidotthia symphoricarpi CBS 119687 TaxID=1392245 RepID=A0A6A6A7E8_9PLEO|nr:uncharacterized protein P153DRAFT_406952 [Dothidotthia symphoricarpi CBS 119687]KAF2126708.1 hypothetical protein P153DRAFT_406952 [Dothidotthia symphoricarpi CBS 119687]